MSSHFFEPLTVETCDRNIRHYRDALRAGTDHPTTCEDQIDRWLDTRRQLQTEDGQRRAREAADVLNLA